MTAQDRKKTSPAHNEAVVPVPAGHLKPHKAPLRPSKTLLVMSLVWLFLYVIVPIEPTQRNQAPALFYLGSGMFLMWLGAWIGEHLSMGAKESPPVGIRKYQRIYYFALWMGLFGIILRTADWIFVRGLSFGVTSLRNRELLEVGSSSLIAVVSLGLMPMILAAYILRLSLSARNVQIGTRLDLVVCLAWPGLNILVGSRSVILVYVFVFILMLSYVTKRIKLHHMLLVAGVIFGVLFVMNLILFNRLEAMGLSYHDTARLSGYTYFVPLTDGFLTFLDRSGETLSKTLFLVAHYAQYVLHGVFEFVFLFENYSGSHTFGTYQFFYVFKALGNFLGIGLNIEDVLSGIPRVGVYETFWGSAYVDFGYFALPFGFLIGLIAGILWRKAYAGDIFSLPLYAVFLYILALSPIVNGILFSGGLFYILSFSLFKAISKLKL